MFNALYNHVNNATNKYYKFTTISYYIYTDRKKEKLKLKAYKQIYRNNDLLLLNLVHKYVLSELLKLEMALDFEFYRVFCSIFLVHEQRMFCPHRSILGCIKSSLLTDFNDLVYENDNIVSELNS